MIEILRGQRLVDPALLEVGPPIAGLALVGASRGGNGGSELPRMLIELALEDSSGQDDLPPSHELEFPCVGRPSRPVRSRSNVAPGLRGNSRANVLNAYDDAHAWMTAWDDEHPAGTQQQAADWTSDLALDGRDVLVRLNAFSLVEH